MMKRLAIALLSGITLLACSEEKATEPQLVVAAPAVVESPAPDFDTRMMEISRDYFALRPEIATYYGVPDEKAGDGISSRLA